MVSRFYKTQWLLGVHFKPGRAVPILKVPAYELSNVHAPLNTVWGALASEVKERLLEARTWGARFRILETVLLTQLTAPAAPHPAVVFAVGAIQAMPHLQTIGRITERIGLSPRRLIEVFTAEVDLTPKVFCRVLRFQRVLALIRRDRQIAEARRVDPLAASRGILGSASSKRASDLTGAATVMS